MRCSISGQEVPTDKLFVLYYPPSMAHHNWTHSVYAAARAREAVEATLDELRNFKQRYVTGPNLTLHLALGALGLALLGYWAFVLATRWESAGFLSAFVAPFVGFVLLVFARFRYKDYKQRKDRWDEAGAAEVERELAEISKLAGELPKDPSAEQAAPLMRRECPEALSEIAFQGKAFHAFTYLDFILFPKLKSPTSKEELPQRHSLNRDAYYVGEVVFDSWRTFHRDRREVIDPRFVGSGGRRGVI
ncbi:MAG: hypothetical protein GC160_01230 [Acidobacteria bacterium]|nr:hypothetical protein [Acidobacteriota bacterium]